MSVKILTVINCIDNRWCFNPLTMCQNIDTKTQSSADVAIMRFGEGTRCLLRALFQRVADVIMVVRSKYSTLKCELNPHNAGMRYPMGAQLITTPIISLLLS